MKIAFWSHTREGACVTTNLACMAAMTAVHSEKKCMLLENHYSLRNIGDLMLPSERIECLREQGQYYNKYGLEHLLKELYSGKNDANMIQHTAIPLLFQNLFYLPQSFILNRDVFNYEFELVRETLFQCLEEAADLLFVDTESNRNLSTTSILSDADLIVVNLRQDTKMLTEFFENHPIIRNKAFFLIGKYQPNHTWNLRRICYRFHIPRQNIGVIPYNLELEEAVTYGRVLQFLNRNIDEKQNKENAFFMRQVDRAVELLHQRIESCQDSRDDK